jgi:hypothetical protein
MVPETSVMFKQLNKADSPRTYYQSVLRYKCLFFLHTLTKIKYIYIIVEYICLNICLSISGVWLCSYIREMSRQMITVIHRAFCWVLELRHGT